MAMRHFVRGMFRHPQPGRYLDRLTEACLRTPERAAERLLSYPVPRTYWREAVYATDKPVLYVVRPRLGRAGGEPCGANRPGRGDGRVAATSATRCSSMTPARFDALLEDFIRRRVWP